MGKVELLQSQCYAGTVKLNYYEINNGKPVLVMLHAQGTNALSYKNTFGELSKHFHVFSVDCPGHGGSEKNKDDYNIVSIGSAVVDFIKNVAAEPAYLAGHSSGGLIAAYAAANTEMCKGLILEDPPFFSCQGERRYKTFNYLDLSTVCHQYIESGSKEDFVLYYFKNQKMWEFFPDKSREKIKAKLCNSAKRYRAKHPQNPLKVPFFPQSALAAYQGMNEYDPFFGEAFYNNTFHAEIPHEDILKKITCKTLLMKAQTNFNEDNVLLAAMSEEDAALVNDLISESEMVRFDCGHGIHIEKQKEFIQAVVNFAP